MTRTRRETSQLLFIVAILAVVLLIFTSPAKAGGNPRATGGGTTIELGAKSTFVFNAVKHQDGSVNGHLVYHFRFLDISIHMKLDCLNIVGNTAEMAGVVTKVNGDAPPFIFVGQRGEFAATDNGEGGDSPPDLISDLFLFPAANCGGFIATPYLPIDGNVQVEP
jgi:hypothetical protein